MKELFQTQRFENLSLREKVLICGGYFLVVLVLFASVFQPKQQEQSRLEERIKVVKSELRTLSINLKDIKQRVEAAGQETKLPESPLDFAQVLSKDKISRLFYKIRKAAKQGNVDIISVRPQVVEEKENYLLLSIHIDTLSHFQEFLNYLERLEGLADSLWVLDVKMETDEEMSPLLSSRLNVQVYMRGET